MRKNRKLILIIVVILILFSKNNIYASNVDEIIDKQIDCIDFKEIDDLFEKDNKFDVIDFSGFKDLVVKAVKGEINLSFTELVKKIIQSIFVELKAHTRLIGEIIILCILSQILKSLDVSFNSHSVSEIGFYMIYIALILLLFKSFTIVSDIVIGTINELQTIMNAVLPTMISLVLASGNITSGTALYSIMIAALDMITAFIKNIVVQIIYFTIILEIINNISKQHILKHFLDFVKKIISQLLKYTVGLFAFIMGLQSITAPIIDGIINKSAKYAMGSIPVVGSALTGVVDTVLSCSVLIKNGVGIGAIIILFLMCVIPLIKIIAMILIYKLTASFVQPVSDDRIVNCISSIGDYCSLLFGVLVTAMIIFIAAIGILVGSTNITMMMR